MITSRPARTAEQIGRTTRGPRPVPPLAPAAALELPPVTDARLPNGLRLVTMRHRSVPVVDLRLHLPFGCVSHAEAAHLELVAATLFDSDDDRLLRGVSVEATRSGRGLTISGSAPADQVGPLLETVSAALLHPTADDSRLHRLRARMVQQISVIRSTPQFVAAEAAVRHRYGALPGAEDVPDATAVTATAPQDVQRMRDLAVRPGAAVLVLVGDLDPVDTEQLVTDLFGAWEAGSPRVGPPEPRRRRAPSRLVHRDGAVQSQIRLAAPGLDRGHPRFPALSLANVVFGGYFSSRLVTELRENRGLAYRVEATFQDCRGLVDICVEADTATAVTTQALAGIRAELREFVDRPPTRDEVEAARRYVLGMSALATAPQAGLAAAVFTDLVLGLPVDWTRRFPEVLRSVRYGDVVDAARDFYGEAAFGGVVVCDTDHLPESDMDPWT